MSGNGETLLVELGTEELPPKALWSLSKVFGEAIYKHLKEQNLVALESDPLKNIYATPRRLAVLIPNVLSRQETQHIERRGPSVQAAVDQEGKPSRAGLAFTESCGVKFGELDTLETDKGSWLVHRSEEAGRNAETLVVEAIEHAVKQLPIPKRMRWGNSNIEFVRPVHWVVAMLGSEVLEGTVLGLSTGNITWGHRFHSDEPITLEQADNYVEALKGGYVIASFSERQDEIYKQIKKLNLSNAEAVTDLTLMNEVTALVEWPQVIVGEFDKSFLSVPKECLIYSMSDHQKYFHYVDASGELVNRFATVSNIESTEPDSVRAGNERVLRARLSDAKFFWETDCKIKLENRLPSLDGVLFHAKLGSILAKAKRISALAEKFAEHTGGDSKEAARAGLLAKADLTSLTVGEFAEMQGVAGRYFATADGESNSVSEAIEQHYQPKYGGDALAEGVVGQTLALADKIDTLVGIFSTGEEPTGVKDPYGLRRAALGVLRLLIEKDTSSTLEELIDLAAGEYDKQGVTVSDESKERVAKYIMERLRSYYMDQAFTSDQINVVMACLPLAPLDFQNRLNAVRAFAELPEAEHLAAANKRISNILRKSSGNVAKLNESLLSEAAEKALAEELVTVGKSAGVLFDKADYAGGLKLLAGLRPTIDAFFDEVMVNVEDEAIKNNRLALLSNVQALFLRTADISILQ